MGIIGLVAESRFFETGLLPVFVEGCRCRGSLDRHTAGSRLQGCIDREGIDLGRFIESV